MASRRGGSKRKKIGSSSASGQAQEEGNLVDNALFMADDAINRYNFVKNLAVLPCNCVKFKVGLHSIKLPLRICNMSFRMVAGGRKGIKQWNSKVMKKKVMEIKKWQNKGKKNMEVIAQDPFKPPCKGQTAKSWS
ncbi:hypothetical protein SLEP1_g41045 [Rubroshorea leprosula]|uniref:Uncharacterized protein n=1 Tax=Rubroshorea leprosula TaxID=152421 RepID=A0AAV5L5G6_9ROSI|nr:hypothetical protein SLEP1_g41045 [Rubroshorea leprosula]